MSAPCYKCERRKPSCHDTCVDYMNWISIEHQKKEHSRSFLTECNLVHISNIIKTKRRNGQ